MRGSATTLCTSLLCNPQFSIPESTLSFSTYCPKVIGSVLQNLIVHTLWEARDTGQMARVTDTFTEALAIISQRDDDGSDLSSTEISPPIDCMWAFSHMGVLPPPKQGGGLRSAICFIVPAPQKSCFNFMVILRAACRRNSDTCGRFDLFQHFEAPVQNCCSLRLREGGSVWFGSNTATFPQCFRNFPAIFHNWIGPTLTAIPPPPPRALNLSMSCPPGGAGGVTGSADPPPPF